MNCTPSSKAIEELGERIAQGVKRMTQRVGEEVGKEGCTLAWLEREVMQALKETGQTLLAGLCELGEAQYVASEIACACGGVATYQGKRTGKSKTLFGEVVVRRGYYLCQQCHHGEHPLDQQLEFWAGGVSGGLFELMALLGAEFDFAEAAKVLEKLTLVDVCANSCRKAAETLGQLVVEEEQQSLRAAWDAKAPQLPTVSEPIAGDFYISVDGVTVHLEEQGWKNQWLGALYTTKASISPKRPDVLEVRTQQASFYTDLGDTKRFGEHLWLEAQRRGIAQAQRLIVIGDGAHWIWNLAEEHFPNAIQILDWYHASAYIWQAAHALYGEGTDFAKQWAKHHLDLLWEGQVATVIAHLQARSSPKAALHEVLTYLRNHQQRMRYDLYRAQGLQIGSGTIESGCKHVIAARLKQAGMIWSHHGARTIAKVRTRLKSRRWEQTLALRSFSPLSYLRKAA
jgi:hypothetical protein